MAVNSCCRLLPCPRLLSCLNKCNYMGGNVPLTKVADLFANGDCNRFQHLVMPAGVAVVVKCYWAGSQNVLQSSSSRAQLAGVRFTPGTEVCWSTQDVIHCLSQEGDATWLTLPEIRPHDLMIHGPLPSATGPLLPHTSCSASPFFIHCRPDRLLYLPVLLLSFYTSCATMVLGTSLSLLCHGPPLPSDPCGAVEPPHSARQTPVHFLPVLPTTPAWATLLLSCLLSSPGSPQWRCGPHRQVATRVFMTICHAGKSTL